MRVAIVHDWLYTLGGAERVLREMLRCYPGADVFTLFDVLSDEERAWIGYERSNTSFLQHLPRIGKIHRLVLPLMPLAIEQLDLSPYDLVISSSYAVAKGVITGPDQVHISYVHSPMRYAWDLQHQYLKENRGPAGVKAMLARLMLHRIRLWDAASGLRPNAIIANSAFVGRRIKNAFGRESEVIYPPVDVTPRAAGAARESYFLTAGRLVSYKNARAVIEAFALMPEQKLIVAGSGPDKEKLKAIAGPNVTFAGFVPDDELRRLMATSRAVVLAAEEDFGIVAVEVQAEGTPVIALGRGGARENVIGEGPGRTGLFFDQPTPEAIAAAVNAFIGREHEFSREACQAHARLFSADRFRHQLTTFVDGEMEKFRTQARSTRIVPVKPKLAIAE